MKSKRKEVNQINPNRPMAKKGDIKMDEKVFAYRIDESLFCPECYEKAIQSIPKDSGVIIPGNPLTRGDIGVYICKQCKKKKGGMDIDGLLNIIQFCSYKISFLEDFFTQPRETDEFLSESGISGLGFILRGLYEDLNFVTDEMRKMQREGIIKEVR
jgi:hypothetical protein